VFSDSANPSRAIPKTPKRPIVRLLLWAVGTVAAALLGAAAVWLVVQASDSLFGKHQSIGQQVAHVRSAAVAAGKDVAFQRRLELRPGVQSDVFVLRPSSVTARSAEIKIYDEEGGDLNLKLAFQPRANDASHGFAFPFEQIALADLNGDGTDEVVGAYLVQGRSINPVHIPVVAYWNDRPTRYELKPVLESPPEPFAASAAAPSKTPFPFDSAILRRRVTLSDPAHHRQLRAQRRKVRLRRARQLRMRVEDEPQQRRSRPRHTQHEHRIPRFGRVQMTIAVYL